jgi:hypothetical protein
MKYTQCLGTLGLAEINCEERTSRIFYVQTVFPNYLIMCLPDFLLITRRFSMKGGCALRIQILILISQTSEFSTSKIQNIYLKKVCYFTLFSGLELRPGPSASVSQNASRSATPGQNMYFTT